jgi:hypothetical protein
MLTAPSNRPPRLTTGGLVREFIAEALDADRGIWAALRNLTFQPQKVVQSYLDGDRSRYVRPTRYVMFSITLATVYTFIIVSWFGASTTELILEVIEPQYIETMTISLEKQAQANNWTGAELAAHQAKVTQFASNFASILAASLQYSSFFIFLLVPIMALVNRWCYPLGAGTYAESLVASSYIYSHAALISLIGLLPAMLFTNVTADASGFMIISGICSAMTFGYIVRATYQIYARRWWELPLALVLFVGGYILFYIVAGSLGFLFGLGLQNDWSTMPWRIISAFGFYSGVVITFVVLLVYLRRMRQLDHSTASRLPKYLLIMLCLGAIMVAFQFAATYKLENVG